MSHPTTLKNKFLIIISGPTGIGKSALATHLAKLYNADIFSADSRQIYKEMSLGTAKPSKEETKKIQHHFIDEISIFEKYSVGHYENQVKLRLNKYFESKEIAIMVGGTGLYLKSVMDGLDEFPEVSHHISDSLNQIFLANGIEYIREALKNADPEYFEIIDKNNHRRIIRALSVVRASGKTYSSFIAKKNESFKNYSEIPILLEMPREELYERINNRVDEMISTGLVEEAKVLHAFRGIQALETVGYQELFDYFEGKADLQASIDKIKQNSRRYAKRQITWFKKYGDWEKFNPSQIREIEGFINSKRFLNKPL